MVLCSFLPGGKAIDPLYIASYMPSLLRSKNDHTTYKTNII